MRKTIFFGKQRLKIPSFLSNSVELNSNCIVGYVCKKVLFSRKYPVFHKLFLNECVTHCSGWFSYSEIPLEKSNTKAKLLPSVFIDCLCPLTVIICRNCDDYLH